jgi:3'-5' exoribonuclease
MSVERLLWMAKSLGVESLSETVLADPRFLVWSGSSKPNQHHYGKGGLAQHTWEVAHLCLQNNKMFTKLEKGVTDQRAFLAALYHDAGKMWDYSPLDLDHKDWQGNEHKRRIHHISRSALVWHDAAEKGGVAAEMHDDILHAILSHHGAREWGSPVSPATRLAWLLHLCDGLSARMDDCYTADRYSNVNRPSMEPESRSQKS